MHYHFIAIGGSAMHNLAIALHLKGDQISGSDDEIFDPSRSRLEKYGLLPSVTGWFPDRIDKGMDAVIAGMHAKPDNPELLKAKSLGLPVYSYPEFLYAHAKNKSRVVIGGSHGKTTITSMILHVLHFHGIDTDYMVGAQLEGFDVMVKLTDDAGLMVMEGDEYPSGPTDPRPKFHVYRPHIAVISGIAWDHINVFRTFDSYLDQFSTFIRHIEKGGTLIFDDEDQEASRLCRDKVRDDITDIPYGTPDYSTDGGHTVVINNDRHYPVQVFGQHNLLNMEASRLVCRQLGLTNMEFFEAIQSFRGASKRMETLFDDGSTCIIRDFAHAPSKLRATVKAVKEQFPEKKLIACMELHTYSSLSRDFMPQYRESMEHADEAIVFFNPAALTLKRLPELHPEDVIEGFGKPGLQVVTKASQLESILHGHLDKNVCLLLMSSAAFGGLDADGLIRGLKFEV